MFKKLKEILGRPDFMNLEVKERDKSANRKALREFTEEFRKKTGADGMVLFLVKNQGERKDSFTSFSEVNAIEVLPLYEDLLFKLAEGFSPTTVASIAAAQKEGSVGSLRDLARNVAGGGSEKLSTDAVAFAMKEAIQDLPQEMQDKVYKRMDKFIEGEEAESKKDNFDDLLEDFKS